MNLTTLRSATRYTVFGDSADTTYADADLDRNLNIYYEKAVQTAMSVCGSWSINGEIAYRDLGSGQNVYTLPADLLTIDKLEIKLATGGEYQEVKMVSAKNHDGSLEEAKPDEPIAVFFDNYFRVYASETINSVTNGLALYYAKDITAQLSATTDSPIIAVPFQDYLVNGAAYEYCKANEMWNKSNRLDKDLTTIEDKIKKHYSSRGGSVPIRMDAPEDDNY